MKHQHWVVFLVTTALGLACAQVDMPVNEGTLSSDSTDEGTGSGSDTVETSDTFEPHGTGTGFTDTEVAPTDTGTGTGTGEGSDTSVVLPTDSGSHSESSDTGTGPEDTGTGPEDTGTGPEDTGTGSEDTGTGPEDTGTGPEDTGTGTGDVCAPECLLGCDFDGSCCECTSGECCDGCKFHPLADAQPCGAVVTEYRCDGSGCGADAQTRSGQPICQGGTAACTGAPEFGAWTGVCGDSALCSSDGATYASCSECPTGCAAGECNTCLGAVWDNRCYWYVATARTWRDAENDCVSGGGHLTSIGSAAENTQVHSLIASDAWIGLRDPSTEVFAVSDNDDCTNVQAVAAAGGMYTGNLSSGFYDDVYPSCAGGFDWYDAFYSFDVPSRSHVFLGANGSAYDTLIAVYNRVTGTGVRGCLGTQVMCNDDYYANHDAGGSVLLEAGGYIAVIDGYDSTGAYRLDIRRFVFSDAAALLYVNWRPGEPSNSGNDEDCVEIYLANGGWNDQGCGDLKGYVCESGG